MFPVQHGSAAPAIETESRAVAQVPYLVTELPTASTQTEYLYQPSLFGPQAVLREGQQAELRPAAPVQRRQKRDRRQQPSLFDDAQPTRTFATSIKAAVYCNAPVAMTQHRVAAATIDFAVLLAGLAVFAASLWFAGTEIVLNKVTIAISSACVLLIGLLYRILFWAGNNDTLGLQLTGTLLLNFDGRRPSRQERLQRIGGGMISVIAIGMGLVWALFDEEHLTWHDYISKTFPTLRS